MADTWITDATLQELFTGLSQSISASSEALSKSITESNKVLDSFNQKANAAIAGLETANDILNQLQASGFNILLMPPASKTFSQRLAESINKPQEDEYTCGIIIYAQAPSVQLTIDRYEALLKVIRAPL